MWRHRTLILLTSLTLLAFCLRVLPLDSQSMWRDEIDTLCFAIGFWDKLQQAVTPALREARLNQVEVGIFQMGTDQSGLTQSRVAAERVNCQPPPGLNGVDPSGGLWPTLRTLLALPGWNGPLYTIAMRPWIGLTGYTPFTLRFSSLLFGLLAIPLTYVLGRRLLCTKAALIGATLVALSPHLVWYSQEAKMYGAISALSLLAILGLRRALDSAGGSALWWAVAVVATTAAIYCHVLAALLIPLHVALSLVWWPRTRWHWRRALVALACLTLPYLPLLIWQARNWLLPAGQGTLFTIQRLDVMLDNTLNGWGGNFIGDPWSRLILGGLALLALSGLAASWPTGRKPEEGTQSRQRRRSTNGWRSPLALLVWIFVPLLGIWLISARQPIFTHRYLIWAAPAFYLLAAAGFVALSQKARSGGLVARALLLIVLVGNTQALVYQATQPIKPDFQAAAAYVEERYQPGELIVFHLSYMAYNFDYYFSDEYEGWGAPAPGSETAEADIDFHMQTNTSDRGTVWLVLSEPEMWDPRGLVKGWMDSHALDPPVERSFAHVTVYRYQLRE